MMVSATSSSSRRWVTLQLFVQTENKEIQSQYFGIHVFYQGRHVRANKKTPMGMVKFGLHRQHG